MKERMPVLFVGHGSPMNAIDDNGYSRKWAEIGKKIKRPEVHYRMGKEIASLRENGAMILGSGNVVHNLSRISWDMQGGQSWAVEFDQDIKENLIDRNHQNIIHYENSGPSSKLAVPTPDHFYPLLYVHKGNRPNNVRGFQENTPDRCLKLRDILFILERSRSLFQERLHSFPSIFRTKWTNKSFPFKSNTGFDVKADSVVDSKLSSFDCDRSL